ncbi:MAG TPA: 5-formyltetrahydrofolate cyclo-ligase [Steroidobacteraceae bacterium]|jgi:5,10-methenyltetrahydrofolate synthetase|nr:5-formyltetrahydrofolate cyclo-ligase [Steroidobacteraceae bacterium]
MTRPAPPASESWDDVRAWRRQMREALIHERLAMPSHVRRAQGEQAKFRLLEQIDLTRYETLGIYFPIRGEIDVRDIAAKHVEAGGRVGLPVVVTRGAPVEFWSWRPGEPLQRGLWNIPIPERRELVIPNVLIVPVVGFDSRAYRLGYGGGYYDRTLAAASPRPFCIGFGYEAFRLDTIYPQPHDIPMDVVVTDHSIVTSRIASDMP